jgi:hypothetical protein
MQRDQVSISGKVCMEAKARQIHKRRQSSTLEDDHRRWTRDISILAAAMNKEIDPISSLQN